MLVIKKLHIETGGKHILRGVTLRIKPGEVHAVMGPNGAGKTTLAMGLMGHPSYKLKVQSSRPEDDQPLAENIKYQIDGKDMIKLSPEKRARAGLFVSFQHPVEITGVSFLAFLRTAYKSLYPNEKIPLSSFKELVKRCLETVSLPVDFMQRSLNEGFSGGEKKRAEIAQLLVLKPKYAILDEVDSGLDIDSLRIVARAIKNLVKKEKTGILLITHYQRILHHIAPDMVHVLVDGRIKKSDGIALVTKIEKEGYATI